MKDKKFLVVNNPRERNGDFGPRQCSGCKNYSSAYICLGKSGDDLFLLCKGCLLDAVDIINKTILQDCIEKGKLYHGR